MSNFHIEYAIPYDSSKTDINYANPTTGYFTIKEPEPTQIGKILFNTNEFKKIMFENKEYTKILYNDLLIWSKDSNTGLRNIEVGDDLSGKTLYFNFPDDFCNDMFSYHAVLVGSEGTYTMINAESDAEAFVSLNNNSDTEQIIYHWSAGETDINISTIKLSDGFGVITFVDKASKAYQYIKIEG